MTVKNIETPYKKAMEQEEVILEALRNQGCRITKQRKLIVDIILNGDCSCCKEIYWEARKQDSSIGIATVYRMVKTLEEIGAIDRRNLYRIGLHTVDGMQGDCTVVMKDKKVVQLPKETFVKALEYGLEKVSGLNVANVDTVLLDSGLS